MRTEDLTQLPEPVNVGIPFHPYADIFPLMEGEAFDELVTDIETKGLLNPIILYEDMILDGRNRYRACLETLGAVSPITQEYTGRDPLGFVISANLKRRHLDASQRAMAAEKLETLKQQGRPKKDAKLHLNRAEAARTLNVSARSIADAKKVREKGIPELGKLVEQGEIAVSNAAKVAEMPKGDQEAIVKLTKKERPGAVKKVRRAQRVEELAAATEAASEELGTQLFNVIYADCPWRFEPYSEDTGMDRAADNHYPTMDVEDIRNLKVPAADDCVLFLWATGPMLVEALSVMSAWGFSYKSHAVWVKPHAGTGYWFRSMHELLLVGTKGDIPAPAPGTQFRSVIELPSTVHSQKPIGFAEMIEEMFPNVALLEMFSRKPRAGWVGWGNEAKPK